MKYYLLLPILLILTAARHDFHTSLAQVQYNPSEKTFEVSLRVFTDDLETVLTKENGGKTVRLDQPNADALASRYLSRQFGLLDNRNQPLRTQWVGKEIEVDVVWIYLEIPYAGNATGLRVKNAVLTEIFADQVNIVNLKGLAKDQTLLFRRDQEVQAISF